jgi:segregation and condensation protein A
LAAATTETVTVTESAPAQPNLNLNIEENLDDFLRNVTWRELLVELVATDKLDPWNIDIAKIVDGYITVIKKMKVLDLHVPANIILAASILLRMKSETLRVFEIEEQAEEAEEAPGIPRVLPEVQPLVPRMRLQPNKRVTLYELMSALDEIMKMKEKRELMFEAASTPIQFYIDKDDIDQRLELVYKMVHDNADKAGMTTFAYLSNRFDRADRVLLDLFIPLLFLAHKQRIIMMQEKFFGEIIIKLNDGKRNG